MKHQNIAPGIMIFDDVLENPNQFIDDLDSLTEINQLAWHDAAQSDGSKDSLNTVVKESRNCKNISIPNFDVAPAKSNETVLLEIHNFLNININPLLNFYCQHYNAHHWKINEGGWQLLKYYEDNYFVNHYDDSKKFPRTISMSFYLNDNFEGGEIEFSRFDLKIKPKANQAIFFPSNYVYNHIVHPVTSGTRYVVVGWWE